MRCLLDLDGVLTNFNKAAFELHNIKEDPFLSLRKPLKSFSEILPLIGLTAEDFYRGMGEEYWANLEWMPDGKRIISLIEDHFAPDDICILTAPIRNKGCVPGKISWIRKNLPRYYYRNQYLIGKPKHFCAAPDSLLVDDSGENTELFQQKGGHVILVPRPWNDVKKRDALNFLERQLAIITRQLKVG